MMSAVGQFGARLYRGEVSFDFVGRKRLWYAISGLILVISIVAVLVRGLSFSVDFKGGAVFTFPSSSTTLIDIVVVFLFTKPMVTLLAGTKFFGNGHPMSGLDPARLGAKTPWRSSVRRNQVRRRPDPANRSTASRNTGGS